MNIKPYPKKVRCSSCDDVVLRIRNRKVVTCKKCVLKISAQRYTENKELLKSLSKQYRIKNKESISLKRKIKYYLNRELVLKKQKQYYVQNIEKVKEKGKEYRIKNKDKILVKNRNRKNLMRTLEKESDINNKYLKYLLDLSSTCPMCYVEYNSKQDKHIDHIKPISVGGKHKKNNIRVICKKCNLSRPKDGRDLLNKK
jgi:5-methylcytosine-specific restriction endonuclease McrA